jgi:hypothetical protein
MELAQLVEYWLGLALAGISMQRANEVDFYTLLYKAVDTKSMLIIF